MTQTIWDFKAKIHDRIFNLPLLKGVKSSEIENFKALLENVASAEKALDIGCGTGEYLGFYKSEGAFFGVDISVKMLECARKKVDGIFLCSSAADLPFRDEIFGFVSAIGLLEYFHDKKKVINEIRRVLVPGGRSIASFTHTSFFNFFRRLWGVEFYQNELNEIKALFNDSGLEVVDIKKSLIQTQVVLKKIK